MSPRAAPPGAAAQLQPAFTEAKRDILGLVQSARNGHRKGGGCIFGVQGPSRAAVPAGSPAHEWQSLGRKTRDLTVEWARRWDGVSSAA